MNEIFETRSIIHQIVAYVSSHSDLAYAAIFFAGFLEAVPVVGSFIPGSTVILSLSALIATGDLSLAAVSASAIIGAALGDGSAYWLGHRYPDRVRALWPLNKYPKIVQRGEAFFRKYGVASVLFARFLPPVRAFVPILAGAAGMKPGRFYRFNIFAILLWAPVHVGPGLFAGIVYKRSGMMAEQLVMPVVIGVAVIGALIWLFRRWRNSPRFARHINRDT